MKQFIFQLEPALRFRTLQRDREQEQLSKLIAACERLRKAFRDKHRERQMMAQSHLNGAYLLGSDLRFVASYLVGLDAECAALNAEIQLCNNAVQLQQAKCLEAERKVEMLDLLKSEKRTVWEKKSQAQLEDLAADSFLSRRARENSLRSQT